VQETQPREEKNHQKHEKNETLIRKTQKEEIITWKNRREPQETKRRSVQETQRRKKIIRNMKKTKL